MSVRTALHQAVAQHQSGNLVEALRIYREILEIEPQNVDALNLGGVASHRLGDVESGINLLRAAVAVNPGHAEVHNNLGNALQAAGQVHEAAAAYHTATKLKPDFADAHYNLGTALQTSGDAESAIDAYRRTIKFKPSFAEAHYRLGVLLHTSGKMDEAMAAYGRTVEADPGHAAANNNLAAGQIARSNYEEAIACCRQALATDPDNAKTLSLLGVAQDNLGLLDEALASYRKAIALDPEFATAHSNLLFCMCHHPGATATEIFDESRRWNEVHAAPFATHARPHANSRDPERRLRIGYVSPDFRRHAVSFFLEPLIAAHDRGEIEVFCYAQVTRPDEITARFRDIADHWCSTMDMDDVALARRIRADEIDILVDLAGHTANNRLPAFAARPAPVQATWLGYPGTTGMDAIDYRLTDAIADPEGEADAVHSETLVRLPETFLCYTPPPEAPNVTPLPASANGHVTFGSFNSLSKVTPEAIETWARILHGVLGSRLLLKAKQLRPGEIGRRFLELFAAHGIDPSRIELAGDVTSTAEHLETLARADIALDSFPYNGTTTTCEALWMGVPVVTLSGERHAGRVTTSLLTTVGLPELSAATREEYIETAVRLAGDPDRLATLRGGLRGRMSAAPLCDAAGFAHNIEAAYRDMWRAWCAENADHG